MSANTTLIAPAAELPDWARLAVNLADPRLGAQAESCSDDFFAPMERMLKPEAACFVPGLYDDNGKWMDGWESRRKRGAGHDWCIIRLGCPGRIAGFDLDTSFFTGNFPPAALLEGCPDGQHPAQASWEPLCATVALEGNRHHLIQATGEAGRVYSHVRVNIYPDGGLARLRVYGQASGNDREVAADGLIDLGATRHGGRALVCNDAHFGAMSNLLLPGRGINMGDGWETRRRRSPGHDWCIIALGIPGEIKRVEVDTAHFKGNYPDRCSLQGIFSPGLDPAAMPAQSLFWPTLLTEQALAADCVQDFELAPSGVISHVRFNLHPDGGVSRLRLWGVPAAGDNT
jgi:allantoicase